MEHVAHQCICMQYILELSKKLEVDPRACVPAFFARLVNISSSYISDICKKEDIHLSAEILATQS